MRTLRASRADRGLRHAFAGLLLSLAALNASAAWAADAPAGQPSAAPALLALEVELNGRATGLIGTFAPTPGGGLSATPDELDQLGFDKMRLPPPRDGLIAFKELPGFSYDYDEPGQRVALNSPPELLKLNRLAPSASPGVAPLAPASTGMVINYTLAASGAREDATGRFGGFNGGGEMEARLFGGFGLLSSSMAATTPSPARAGVVRLDTRWTWEDPRRLTAVNVGDLVSTGLSWTRPIRMGGIGYSRSFDLRPDLITRPVPVLRGTAQAPSTLDLFVDGTKVYSSELPAGPFEVSPGPPRAGAGLTEVVVRDLLGREERLEVPFYASDALLSRGFFDFGVELGFARRNYGIRSNDYDRRLALSGSVRYGASDRLTLQAHGEAMRDLQLVGAGAVIDVASYAIASVAVSGSRSSAGKGANLDIGVESRHGPFSASVRAVRSFGDYHDLASITAEDRQLSGFDLKKYAPPKRIEQVQVGSELWSGSQLSFSYARVERTEDKAKLATLSVSHNFGGMTTYLRGWKDFSKTGARGLMLGLSLPLGPRTFTSNELALNGRRVSAVSEVASNAGLEPGSFSWRARIAQGDSNERLAGAAYVSRYGRIEAGLQQAGGRATAFAQAAGALVIADRDVFASRRIDGAFAVVDAGAPNVPVLFENRPAGKTGRSGRLLIPDLLPYQVNRIAFDTRFLPLDRHVENEEFTIVPRRGSGAALKLPARRFSQAALVNFVDGDGKPLQPGAAGRIEAAGADFLVGYDGEAYISGLQEENIASIEDAQGRRCQAFFRFKPKAGDQVRLDAVACLPLRMVQDKAGRTLASATATNEPDLAP